MSSDFQVTPGVGALLIDKRLQANMGIARIGVHENFDAARTELVWDKACAGNIKVDICSGSNLVKLLLGHTEAVFDQQPVVPFLGQRWCVTLEEIADKSDIKTAVVGEFLFDRVVWPGIGALVVVNIMAQFVQRQQIVKIVPGDATERILTDKPANNDPEFLVRRKHNNQSQDSSIRRP